MTRASRSWCYGWLVALLVLSFLTIQVSDSWALGPMSKISRPAKMSEKLIRGLNNVAFCWVEIPNHIFQESFSTDIFTGVWHGGCKGIKRTGKRLSVGLYETLTFFDPGPTNFEPVYEPEVVLLEHVD